MSYSFIVRIIIDLRFYLYVYEFLIIKLSYFIGYFYLQRGEVKIMRINCLNPTRPLSFSYAW